MILLYLVTFAILKIQPIETSIVLSSLALFVAIITCRVARVNYQRNEKFLVYSYWLQQRTKEADKQIKEGMTKGEIKNALDTIDKIRKLNELFSKEFPDPSK